MKWFLTTTLTILITVNAGIVNAKDFLNGVIVKVADGDTATILTANEKYFEIRFYGIDTPETKNPKYGWPAQPFSKEAKAFTKKMIAGKIVSIRLKGDVTYGRLVGEIFIDGRSVNRELVRAGLAWWNKPYAKNDLDIARLAKKARKKKNGLWAGNNPISPWDWRNNKGYSKSLEPRAKESLNELRKIISNTE